MNANIKSSKQITASPIWHTDNYTAVKSVLTNRTIYINHSLNQFLIPPTWNKEQLKITIDEFLSNYNTILTANNNKNKFAEIKILKLYISSLYNSNDIIQFGKGISDLILFLRSPTYNDGGRYAKTTCERIVHLGGSLFINLYCNQLIAFPIHKTLFSSKCFNIKNMGYSDNFKSIFKLLSNYMPLRLIERFPRIIYTFLSRSGIHELCDITPDTYHWTVDDSYNMQLDMLRARSSFGNALIIALQNQQIPKRYSKEDFGLGSASYRMIDDFITVLDEDPSLEQWVKFGIEFRSSLKKRISDATLGLRSFFTYLLVNSHISRNPKDYFDKHNQPSPLYSSINVYKPTYKSIIDFLNFVYIHTCCEEDIFGNPVPMDARHFGNPLSFDGYNNRNNQGETHRECMPTYLINMAKEILLENDFEWAKQFTSDWIKLLNSETGEYVKIWSPVRVIAMLHKFILPSRTYQVRMLDSGEGDTFRYEGSGEWVRNTAPHAPNSTTTKIVQNGVFRKYIRQDKTDGAIFYYNTNKTRTDNNNKGYVMPWENVEMLRYLTILRDWQEKYNPIITATKWGDLKELRPHMTPDELSKLGSSYFLFRDPGNKFNSNNDEPLSDGRLKLFYTSLMCTIEERLHAIGLHDIHLTKQITNTKSTRYQPTPVFDLHSLRVTVITALYENGLPPEILVKIVGHFNYIMTLYYVKFNPEKITELIDLANLNIQKQEQDEWLKYLKKAHREEVESMVAYRHESALDALFSGTRQGAIIMDHGICSCGQGRCHEGLAVQDPESGKTSFHPVPGGANNCVRCRFFLTGPAFIHGLIAHFEHLEYLLKNYTKDAPKLQSNYNTINYQFLHAIQEKIPFNKLRELELAQSALDSCWAKSDPIALSMHATYILILQCKEIANRSWAKNENGLMSLITVGGIEQIDTALAECHEFDLLLRIVERANLFQGVSEAFNPNRDLCRMLDALLTNNNKSAIFCTLSYEESLVATQDFCRLMKARLDHNNMIQLIDNKISLEELGLTIDIDDKIRDIKALQLQRITPKQVSIQSTSNESVLNFKPQRMNKLATKRNLNGGDK